MENQIKVLGELGSRVQEYLDLGISLLTELDNIVAAERDHAAGEECEAAYVRSQAARDLMQAIRTNGQGNAFRWRA